ncbi:hypothetical protein [Lysobacter firmicutimachus]|uniref:Uncharacterized protein n=1 Tax=Lysobacter firmicutimachus TaxID=1792846 RepID=A0ABU8CYZ5_9GAMM
MQDPPESMHDRTLSGTEADWGGATATIRLLDRDSSPVVLLAEGLRTAAALGTSAEDRPSGLPIVVRDVPECGM